MGQKTSVQLKTAKKASSQSKRVVHFIPAQPFLSDLTWTNSGSLQVSASL